MELNCQLVLKPTQHVTAKGHKHLKRKNKIKSRVSVPSKLKTFVTVMNRQGERRNRMTYLMKMYIGGRMNHPTLDLL